MARLNTKQIIAVSLETAMQNVGIAVLVLQVTKMVWMVMFMWFTPDMDIVSSSMYFIPAMIYPSAVQPGVPLRRHGPAISHRLPSLQVGLYACMFVFLFSF